MDQTNPRRTPPSPELSWDELNSIEKMWAGVYGAIGSKLIRTIRSLCEERDERQQFLQWLYTHGSLTAWGSEAVGKVAEVYTLAEQRHKDEMLEKYCGDEETR